MELYLRDTEHFTEHWWDLYLEERDFWDNLPLLPDALLRRRCVRSPSPLLLEILTT